jgi:hypothetical protein
LSEEEENTAWKMEEEENTTWKMKNEEWIFILSFCLSIALIT